MDYEMLGKALLDADNRQNKEKGVYTIFEWNELSDTSKQFYCTSAKAVADIIFGKMFGAQERSE